MATRTLGSTDLRMMPFGLGTMPLSIAGRPSAEDSTAVIHRAIELGVTFFDSADSYCLDESDKHHSETLLRQAIDSYPGDKSKVIVGTKGGMLRPEGGWKRGVEPEQIRAAIQGSHQALTLGQKPIPLWMLHTCEDDKDGNVKLEETLQPVLEAVQAGLISHVGLSNATVDQIERANKILPIVCVENRYSLWDRSGEEVLQYCKEHSITYFPYGVLGGSAARRGEKKIGESFPGLASLAEGKGVSVEALVLAWLSHRWPNIVVLVGSRQIANVEDSLSAAQVQLSAEELSAIEAAAA